MKMATVLVCLAMAGCIPMGPPLSPLIGAAREGDTARMAELLASGADPNGRGGVNHWTPLMHAIHKNQAGSVRVLLGAGADLNARAGNQTALVMAAGYGYADIVKLLLDRGATPTAEALDAAVGGVPDIDRFTVGRCRWTEAPPSLSGSMWRSSLCRSRWKATMTCPNGHPGQFTRCTNIAF